MFTNYRHYLIVVPIIYYLKLVDIDNPACMDWVKICTFPTVAFSNTLQPKEKMDRAISPWRSHLFSSLILTLL